MRSVRCAPLLAVLALATAACGQAAGGSRSLTPSDWVQRGIDQFRAATSLDVIPDAAGEGSCGNVQPTCSLYTLTQTSSTAPASAAMPCRSIPSCAEVFFTPVAAKLEFCDPPTADQVEVDGPSGSCVERSTFTMDFDRNTGNILAVDIALDDGSHEVWPTYEFENYVVGDHALDTPTPSPPQDSGTAQVLITGDVRVSTAHLTGLCELNGTSPGVLFLGGDNSALAAATPALLSLKVTFDPILASAAAQTTVRIYPGDPARNGSAKIAEYNGALSSTAIGADIWHRTLTGTLREVGVSGQITLSATIDCD